MIFFIKNNKLKHTHKNKSILFIEINGKIWNK